MNAELETKAPKVQRSSCTPRRYCKRRLRVLRSIHWTRIFSITNDGSKSHGFYIKTTRLRGTRSRRSICLYRSENGRCSKIVKNSQIGVSRHLDSSTTTQMAKIMVQYGRPSCSSWAESVRSSFGRTIMRKAIWENPIKARLGEGFQLGMLIRTPWKRVILICVCGWRKIGWKETKTLIRCGRYSTKKSIWENQHLAWIMCIWDALKDNVEISKDVVDNSRNHVWIAKLPAGMVLWYGRSCKEMCGTILWVSKQDDSTTLHSIYSVHRWPPLQRRRNEICWRIVTCMLSNCSEMLILGTNWTTWYSMVSK